MFTIHEIKVFGCDSVTPSIDLWETLLAKGSDAFGLDSRPYWELGLCLGFDKAGFNGMGMKLLRKYATQFSEPHLDRESHPPILELLTVTGVADEEFYRQFYKDLAGSDFFEPMIDYLVDEGEPKIFTVFGSRNIKLANNTAAARLRSYVGKTKWEESDIGTIRNTVIASAVAVYPLFFGHAVSLNFETYQNVLHCSGNNPEGWGQSRFFVNAVQQALYAH